MKHTLRVPTEMYAFIETEVEGSVEEAVAVYNELKAAIAPKPVNAMPTKEFNEHLDEYLQTGKLVNGGDFWEEMSPAQQAVFKEIKKSFKRTN